MPPGGAFPLWAAFSAAAGDTALAVPGVVAAPGAGAGAVGEGTTSVAAGAAGGLAAGVGDTAPLGAIGLGSSWATGGLFDIVCQMAKITTRTTTITTTTTTGLTSCFNPIHLLRNLHVRASKRFLSSHRRDPATRWAAPPSTHSPPRSLPLGITAENLDVGGDLF